MTVNHWIHRLFLLLRNPAVICFAWDELRNNSGCLLLLRGADCSAPCVLQRAGLGWTGSGCGVEPHGYLPGIRWRGIPVGHLHHQSSSGAPANKRWDGRCLVSEPMARSHEPVEQERLESFHRILFKPGYMGWFTYILVKLVFFYAWFEIPQRGLIAFWSMKSKLLSRCDTQLKSRWFPGSDAENRIGSVTCSH